MPGSKSAVGRRGGRGAALWVAVACSAVLASAFAATASSATTAIPSGDIKFGSIESLSGVNGTVGGSVKTMVDVAAAYLNAHGGIAGHQVQVEHCDAKSDPATALSCARQLVDDKVTGVLAFGIGPEKDQTLPFFMKSKMPVISNNSNQFLFDYHNYPYYFSVGPTDHQIAQSWINYAKAKSLSKVGSLSDGQPFGDELAQFSKGSAKVANVSWTTGSTFSPTAVDITTQLRELQSAGTQVIVTGALTNVPRIFSGLAQIGWKPILLTTGVPLQLPASVVGGMAASTYVYCNNSIKQGGSVFPQTSELLDKAESGLNSKSASSAIQYSDIFTVYKAAITKAKSLNADAIRKAVESLKKVRSVDPQVSFSYSSRNHGGYPKRGPKICSYSPLGPHQMPYAVYP